MEEIQELVYILTKYKVRTIEIIGDESRQYDSKLYQFYEAVQKGEIEGFRYNNYLDIYHSDESENYRAKGY